MATTADTAERPDTTSRVGRWLKRLSRSERALWVLFWASFAETIIVPIPIEVILIPFMATNRHRLWTIATVVTIGCLACPRLINPPIDIVIC